MNTIEQVTSAFTELDHLRSKDEANENMIRLLNEQNELLSMEMSKMASDHATELRKTKQRCDLAVRREAEIEGLLSTVAADLSSIAGRVLAVMRKREGDKTPAVMPERGPGPVSSHPLLPTVDPEVAAFAPRPGRVIPEDDDEMVQDVRQMVRNLPAHRAGSAGR